MNEDKKELLRSINELEAKIKRTKQKKEADKRYFAQLYDRNQLVIVSSLLPALMIGWKGGKMVRSKRALKQFLKYGFLTSMNILRIFNKLK